MFRRIAVLHQDSLFRKCKWIALLQMKKDISMEEWSIFFSATFLTCQSAGFHLQNWPFDWMFPWGKWKILIWKKHTARIQIGVASHNFFCGIIRQIGFGELKFRCEFFRFIVAAPHNNTWCCYMVSVAQVTTWLGVSLRNTKLEKKNIKSLRERYIKQEVFRPIDWFLHLVMELKILDQEKRDFSACLNIDGLLAECSRESGQGPDSK